MVAVKALETETQTSPAPLIERDSMASAIREHWPEYLMEAAGLGAFMISACIVAVLLDHPSSPVHEAIDDATIRRLLGGIAMALTFLAIVFSPWGKRSGAHLNPAVTLTYVLLGKVRRWDALFYILAQFAGGIAGVVVAELIVGLPLGHSSVNYAVTLPGDEGLSAAFVAELLISLIMMSTVLAVSNTARFTRFTPFFAATLIASYITLEAPLSGMSMNPARTFGSAFSAHEWTAIWVYFTAPLMGMFLAGQVYRFRHGVRAVYCAKLHHHNDQRCIFRCDFSQLNGGN